MPATSVSDQLFRVLNFYLCMEKISSLSLISWNVNGIRAAQRKGFLEWLHHHRYSIVCLQETKISHPDQLSKSLAQPDGYFAYFHCATEKKGYSGTAVYTREEPLEVKTFFGVDSLLSREGRMMEVHFRDFVLLNIYFPNGGSGEERLRYKMRFYAEFLMYISDLVAQGKHVVFCGDVNTAHREIDLARPKENQKTSGFLSEERAWMDDLLAAGFVDVFRKTYPEQVRYSWWDMKTRARERNIGWRIDYFFADKEFSSRVNDTEYLTDIPGSDHCPVKMTLRI